MQLVLLRHGIAIDREDPDCPIDEQRSLTALGRRKTKRAVRGLARIMPTPTLVCASPLVRARQTAEIAAAALGIDEEHISQLDQLEPEGDPVQVLEYVRAQDAEVVLCVGHSPNLDRVLAEALGLSVGFGLALKKAGAASITLDSSGASLQWFVPPKILRLLGARD